jgi:hypothetical protein
MFFASGCARATPTFALLALVLATAACGGSDDSGDAPPAPTASPSTTATPVDGSPTATATPERPATGFWVASSTLRVVSRYDTAGKIRTPVIDLKGALGPVGGITALRFLDSTNLLGFFDPADPTKKEAVVLIDARKGVIKNRAWFIDDAELADVEVTNLITGFIPNTLLIPKRESVLRVLYDKTFNASTTATVFLAPTTLSACPFSQIEHAGLVTTNGTKTIVMLSSGANARINVFGFANGVPTCVTTYNYGASGQPTSSADIPVNALRASDGALYVLFQNPTRSKIVKYAFDGKRISSPSVVYSDQAVLGATPRGLLSRASGKLLVGNSTDDRLYEITTSGAFTGFFIDNSFTVDVSTLVTP